MLKIGAERPLILLDWHQTVSLQEKPSHTPEVPQRSVAVIQQFLDAGYQLDICSFTAKTKTQQAVINGVAALNQRLSAIRDIITNSGVHSESVGRSDVQYCAYRRKGR